MLNDWPSTSPDVPDLYPQDLRPEIDEINEWVYETVNNGVYKTQVHFPQPRLPSLTNITSRLQRVIGHSSLCVPNHTPCSLPGTSQVRIDARGLRSQRETALRLPRQIGETPRRRRKAVLGRTREGPADRGRCQTLPHLGQVRRRVPVRNLYRAPHRRMC